MKAIKPKHFIPIYGMMELNTECIGDKKKTTDDALNVTFMLGYHTVLLLFLTFFLAEIF